MITIDIRKEFMGDWISREAGERLRKLIVEAVRQHKAVEIDFTNMMIASTSFFDEGIAKLAGEGWSREDLASRVHFKNLHRKDKSLMEALCKNRM